MIVFLAMKDQANMGYLFSQCLKAVGVEACAIGFRPINRDKEKQARIYKVNWLDDPVSKRNKLEETKDISRGFVAHYGLPPFPLWTYRFDKEEEYQEFSQIIKDAWIVVWMHSQFQQIIHGPRAKNYAVFHGGSWYRNNPQKMNEIFNRLVNVSLIQTGDLLDLGAKNEKWILPGIDTDAIQPHYSFAGGEKIIIGHFPSKPAIKGTEAINEVITMLKESRGLADRFEYRTSEGDYPECLVPWEENLQRMAPCDIYIEGLNLQLNGKPYGEWGVTTLEAAALGCVPVSHFLSAERYKKDYGECPVYVANTKGQLAMQLIMLLSMSQEKLLREKMLARRWVQMQHSYTATGWRLKEALGIDDWRLMIEKEVA